MEEKDVEVLEIDAKDFMPDDCEEIVETINVSGGGNHEEVSEEEVSEDEVI
jgi:hypothetical protein